MTQSDAEGPEPPPFLLLIEDTPVVLDSRVAEGFEVEVREINQAFARHPEKFDDRHGFRLTTAQRDFLRSQGVIPKPAGRGGSHVPPMVYTQKGVARLATVMRAPAALEFTDAMIDLATEVYRQLAQGIETPRISTPSRYLPLPEEDASQFRRLRRTLMEQLDSLMNSRLGSDGPTIREGLSDASVTLYEDVIARLKRRSLENDKIAAETARILEEIETARADRQLKARRAHLEDTALHIQNQRAQIDLVRESLELLAEMEPPAIARLNQSFLPGAAGTLRLPAPEDEMHDDH